MTEEAQQKIIALLNSCPPFTVVPDNRDWRLLTVSVTYVEDSTTKKMNVLYETLNEISIVLIEGKERN